MAEPVDSKQEPTRASIDYAIEVFSLRKRYRSQHVLNGLSLQVPMGKIYGLLGPSGCGKTTLLKCIVGRLAPNSGMVRVMGRRPGSPGHGVPGPLIGYMPQDMALYREFTIAEILKYFGRIFCMSTADIDARISFLAALLKFPNKNSVIGQLSGGQQRRVSFACALLHQPPLLILDEPTVGVDPLLRQCIWYHLLSIVNKKERPTSVVITTHYIEEARQGHMVAMMRDGRVLAESNPNSLLNLYGESSLESVFLKLCRTYSATGDVAGKPSSVKAAGPDVEYRDSVSIAERLRAAFVPPSPRRVLSVIAKEATNLRRRLGFLLFLFTLPVLQIVIFCVCIGGSPFGLRLAVVNLDGPDGWGARFVRYLDNTTLNKAIFPDLESARAEVRGALAWAVLHLSPNFTQSLQHRLMTPLVASNASIAEGSIHLQLDNTNYQVSSVLRQSIVQSMQRFAEDLLREHGLTPAMIRPPLVVEPPLLGGVNPSFTEFMAPGFIVSIVYFMATGLTALSFVLERKEGLLDRSLVSGMSIVEITLGHVISQLFIMAGQVAFLLMFSLLAFGIPCRGSIALVVLQCLASSFSGMSLGLLISAVCSAETSAIQAALGVMYPSLLLSGVLWPIEAMPWYMRRCTALLPTTLSVEAIRCIMSRGFGLASSAVWTGLMSSLAWSAGLTILAIFLLKARGV